MNQSLLQSLYEASEQDFRYGIGLLNMDGEVPALPMIQCYYQCWTKEVLGAVASALADGLEISISADHVYLATKERIQAQEHQGPETSVLRAPVWNALLENPDPDAARRFDALSNALGHFTLILQTAEWECITTVLRPNGVTQLGDVRRTTLPTPPL